MTMTSRELLDLAERRLLALDEEVVRSGNFTERAAVAGELRNLGTARAQHELLRLQAAEAQSRISRTGTRAIPNHEGVATALPSWQLP